MLNVAIQVMRDSDRLKSITPQQNSREGQDKTVPCRRICLIV